MQEVLIVYKNPHREVRGRLDVTFADEVCAITKPQTTYMTEKEKKLFCFDHIEVIGNFQFER